MSEDFIALIPTTPEFAPAPELLEKAKNLLARFLPHAEEIVAAVTQEIRFVDQGGNFERISCPKCASELHTDWWQEVMDRAYESKFQRLEVVTPCCGFATTLNDLEYQRPAGFARCRLEARNPKQKELSSEQLERLAGLLGTPLRQIWVHY